MQDLKPFWSKLWNSLPEVREFIEGGSDKLSPYTKKAIQSFLNTLESGSSEGSFLEEAALRIREELSSGNAGAFMGAMEEFAAGRSDVLELFFPEALFGGTSPEDQEEFIRKRRTVKVSALNPDPITDPASQMVFTSNVLLTLPPEQYKSRLSESILERVKEVEAEDQKYWFDHPILMGVETEANEMIYGLKGLAETFAWEKSKGHAASDARMTVL
ncbi:MAG: hypothetical protein PQJ50_14890, partial [Spirochaetales bacterium]|nr:hypothetical protein [Spirochaetales bacterium]